MTEWFKLAALSLLISTSMTAAFATAAFAIWRALANSIRSHRTINDSPVLPYIAPMNWITIGIALNFAMLAVSAAVFAFILFQ